MRGKKEKRILRMGHDHQAMYIDPLFVSQLNTNEKQAFAVTLLLKACHRSGAIHNATPAMIARKAGISFYHAQKALKTILNKNWGFLRRGTLYLVSLEKGFKLARRVCPFHPENFKQVLFDLNYMILRKFLVSQDYVIRYKRHDRLLNQGAYLSFERIQALNKKRKEDSSIFHGTFLEENVTGMRKLSEVLHCSTGKASQFIRQLKERGLISAAPKIEKLGNGDVADYAPLYNQPKNVGYLYQYKENTFIHYGTLIKILRI